MIEPVAPQGWTWTAPAGWTWDHHAIADQRDRKRLLDDPELPEFARALLTGPIDTPHFDAREEAVAGIAPDFPRDEEEHPGELAALRFAVLPRRLVTARRVPVASLWGAFCAARDGRAPDSPAAMLDRVLETFGATVLARAEALGRTLDEIEDALLANRPRGDRVALGQVRRDATRLQRGTAPLVRMLSRDADTLPDWFETAETAGGRAARRAVLAAQDELASVQARARALQDELSALQAEQTNRRLYVLSVATVMIMPPTLVTGFFGMNTGGLPFEEPEWGTLAAAGTVALAAGLAFAMLRRFRLL